MGVIQQVADMMVGTLGEGAVFYKMPSSSIGEALLEDPVEVCIGRDQLNPPVESVTGELHPRVRGEEGGTREEFNIVATLEAHHRRGMENNKREGGTEVLYSGARDG